MQRRGLLLGALALTLGACAKDDTQDSRAGLTQREKDSILANSTIPGAKAVKKTLTTADSAVARQSRIDSAQQNP